MCHLEDEDALDLEQQGSVLGLLPILYITQHTEEVGGGVMWLCGL